MRISDWSSDVCSSDLGNIANGTITIDVVDDVPTAADDAGLSVAEDGADIGGNVLTNDTPGADGATLTSVTIGGVTTAINAVGTTNVSGAFGAYTFTAAGAWTFNPSTNQIGRASCRERVCQYV